MRKETNLRRSIAKWMLCGSAAALGLTSGAAHAVTIWNVESSLSGTATATGVANPVWSTVRRTGTTCNGAPTVLTNQYTNGTQIGGRHGGIATNQPLVAKNLSGTMHNSGLLIPANTMAMHPGPEGECAVLRFTVPANQPVGGSYSINAHFRGAYPTAASPNAPGDKGPGDGVKGYILKNGVQQGGWSADTANVGGQGTTLSGIILNPGDTIEFAVHMKLDYKYDTTLLTGRITGPDPVVTPPPPPINTCCDPNLNVHKIQPLFTDVNSTNITGLYGLQFDPTTSAAAGFRTAMNNTAFIASVMSGLNGYLVVHGDMKTDNVANQSWPGGSGPVANFWTNIATTPLAGGLFLYWEDTPIAQSNGGNYSTFSPANMAISGPGQPHMKKDGTRYAIKFSYWLYYWNAQNQLLRRPVFCNDMKDQYLGYLENNQNSRIAAGGGGSKGLAETVDRPSTAAQKVRFGNPEVVDEAMLQAMPEELRRKLKK